jgi:hypothetical protein
MVGPPINFFGSDTYHLSTLLGTYDFVLHTNDMDFLNRNWPKFKAAMSYITAKIDSTGMLSVTGTSDWGRYTQGGHNTEANALMYGTLIYAAILSGWANEPDLGTNWTTLATKLKIAINDPANNWDDGAGAFKDSDTDGSVHPEDGNSLALFYNMATSEHIPLISKQLTMNWGPIGAICPELPGNIVPYVESMEVKGHLVARQATRSLDLMRLSWGWYLNNPYGTQSTCIEGYLADGSFGYRHDTGYNEDYSYPSHAHGWSTGPTYGLSTYVLGIQLNEPGGAKWTLAPQFGDLTSVEGGFTTLTGKFSAKWELTARGYTLSYDTPTGTTGTLLLPANLDKAPTIEIDGQVYSDGEYDSTAGTVTITGQEGGQKSLIVTY